ncbi:hypothetical protein AKJ65_05025 [candidate division MSBL1 archaeon SCGC-AAA259E19]|uniref:BFN domain-containing protein n=2 Tax=candidate division MSBL1 TaxID=215777 RepID=A0A133UB09_9EURY|nr:hypothetical protein AKJ57_01365 [candidate division MSBL1 archaeon SCGC-AAA259A05]KXA94232.1 hypothetical protein AKJ65_05025 [candidate division MSBL1 archaeon SCGC-AAA259E19]
MNSLKAHVGGVYKTKQGFMVALRSEDSRKVLPVFVSKNQARSIKLGLSEKESPRPLTHDILRQVIEDQDLTVESVTVDDLFKGTFTAELRLKRGDRTFPYDVRPSDAIALAVRTDTDIHVSGDVMDRAGKDVEGRAEDPRELALRRFEDKSQE